jgi:hypothetical protein
LIQLSSGAAVFGQRAIMTGDEPTPLMDQWPLGQRNHELASDRSGEFLAKAHECLILADRYSGRLSERTFRGAAESWFLLARLEAARDPALPQTAKEE